MREGGEGGRARGREREREREVDKTWMERRGCHIVPLLAHVDSPHCPCQQRDYFLEKKSSDSYVDSLKSSDFYMRKEKLRLIYGHFEKFGLICDKKKVRTHIWYI